MSAPRRTVVLSPEAEADLEDIMVFGRRLWGERQANEYAATIYGALQDLIRFPKIGPEKPELFAGARVLPVERHLIVYRIEGMSVTIVRILHGWMDIPAQFP